MVETSQIPPPRQVIADALETLEIELVHNDQCAQETQYWLENTGLDDSELCDLTTLPFVTIDNPDSRDLDQALLIEKTDSGYRVRYALADASYYIQPGSALFTEALARGATFYTPTMAAPMLPVQLSEGLISLNPHVDRRALVFDMQVDAAGITRRTTIVRAKIRSHAKLDYGSVQAWLDAGASAGASAGAAASDDTDESVENSYDSSLLLLRELGLKLITAAENRGIVKFDRTETYISVQEQPPRFEMSVRKRYETERFNEQISLMCNMQGAEMLLVLEGANDVLQAVFRVHDAPLRKSLKLLRETLDQFSRNQEEPELWRWQEQQSLSDYLNSLPQADIYKRRVRAVQRQIMHAQRGSSYEPIASEHHALKAASYARFSSPMREVVGIFTHKELLEALGNTAFENHVDEKLRDAVIESATRARQKQRQLDKKIEFAALFQQFSLELSTKTHKTHVGTIMGMRKDRLYINLDDSAIDIKMYKENLNEIFSTRYEINNTIATPNSDNAPIWELGQSVIVSLVRYDNEHNRFYFGMNNS
ncbi:MAG: ribonuclease R [Granulosicoccus sp.]|jgi:ribonuclease R